MARIVPSRAASIRSSPRRVATLSATSTISMFMPLAIAAGQAVKAGDMLLSIEAMKMETALHAERDGKIAEVLVKAGDQIDAKDLLIRLKN